MVFGSRLRRLSERFLANVTKVYQAKGIDFDASWFPFFYLLDEHESLTLREMSETLKTSHSAVSQMMSNLERRALVEIKKDPEDKRRRNVQLTEKGKELLAQVRPIWNGLQKAMAEILEQDEFNAKLISIIDNIEATFDEEELSERILRQL